MKKILAMLLCLVMAFGLVACGNTDPVTDTDSAPASTGEITSTDTGSESATSSVDTSTNTSTDTESSGSSSSANTDEVTLQEDVIPNWVIANDQIKERAVIYDLDKYEPGDKLEDLEVWSVKTGHAAGVKYREDTVFGDVVIVAGSYSAIYEYPSGKELWGTNNPGNNTHSIEILPSGNIVLANSTGNSLRMFAASEILKGNKGGAQRYTDYKLEGAHGVLWDPEYEVLWALGGHELVAYFLTGSGVSEKLVVVPDMGTPFDVGYGHDLTPDYMDTRYLYFTAGSVYRFDKETNEVMTSFPYASDFKQPEVKGFCHSPNDKYISTGELGGAGKFFANSSKESWLTDTLIFFYKEAKKGKVSMKKIEIVAEESAFYKVRYFCGQYQ